MTSYVRAGQVLSLQTVCTDHVALVQQVQHRMFHNFVKLVSNSDTQLPPQCANDISGSRVRNTSTCQCNYSSQLFLRTVLTFTFSMVCDVPKLLSPLADVSILGVQTSWDVHDYDTLTGATGFLHVVLDSWLKRTDCCLAMLGMCRSNWNT